MHDPTRREVPNESQLVTRIEFDAFSKKLDEKTTKISDTLENHEGQIGKINMSIDDIGLSMNFLEKNLKSGLNGIDRRISDISNFLIQQNETMQNFNDKSDQARTRNLEEQLVRHESAIKEHMATSDNKLKNVVKVVDEFKEAHNSGKERKTAFWTNIITATVGVLIALINIVPALFNN